MTQLIQSGWLDISQHDATLVAFEDNYTIEMSNSLNNNVGRDGTVTGAKVNFSDYTKIANYGVLILRLTSGTTYTIIGKSQELTATAGINTVTFTTPIENVYSSDIIAVATKGVSTSASYYYITSTAKVPINDSATAKVWYKSSGSANYSTYSTGASININDGGSVFGVMCIAALMDSPKVIVVGDSISAGYPLNSSYRYNGTNKDRLAAYAAVAYRNLNWTLEIGGNTQTSNNANEVLVSDLVETGYITIWDKQPQYLHIHVGVNDIYDFVSQHANWYGTPITTPGTPTSEEIITSGTEYLAKLDAILAKCRTNNCKLIIDSIFPWTGNAANTTGNHIMNTMRDAWNIRLANWAVGKSDVSFVPIGGFLGTVRLTAKSGDPAPTSGNLWDLRTNYVYGTDGLGVHLTQEGCSAAGSAVAGFLSAPKAGSSGGLFRGGRRF